MKFFLSELAKMAGAEPPAQDAAVSGYSIDSRTAGQGDLFFALPGARRDGHEFVEAALRQGAAGAVVSRNWPAPRSLAGRLLAVEDPMDAMARMAAAARRRWRGRMLGVTGSNGKTTTKELAADALSLACRTARSAGNFNNHLGLPLSILRMPDEAEAAVFELGMNHAGEITHLASIAQPEIGLVTNVTSAHLENFSSVDEIARAKRELIDALPERGTAILNADDERVRKFARGFPGRVVTFGVEHPADVRALEVENLGAEGMRFQVEIAGGAAGSRLAFQTPLLGRHNVLNVLAAIAAAVVFDIEPASLASVFASARPSGWRGVIEQAAGVTWVNDSYNANPRAVGEMLEVLRSIPARRKIAVLGEMLELGPRSAELHHELGAEAARKGVDLLVAVRGEAKEFAAGARAQGMAADRALFFENPGEVGEFLAQTVEPGDAVLFKASRGVRIEKALEAARAGLEARERREGRMERV